MRSLVLKQVVRQQGDQTFVHMLNELRVGLCSAHTLARLNACHVNSKPCPRDGILPTKLYCTNANVDAENNARLQGLHGESVSFQVLTRRHAPVTLPVVIRPVFAK